LKYPIISDIEYGISFATVHKTAHDNARANLIKHEEQAIADKRIETLTLSELKPRLFNGLYRRKFHCLKSLASVG
jgi:hypothetical protein